MRCVVPLSLLLALSPTLARAQAPGWASLDLPGGRRATRFVPSAVRACEPAPLVVFLHGAGGTPEGYHAHLEPHAEALGAVLLLPQAAGAGWGGGDVAAITAGMDALEAELTIDARRTYFAGHSAGGAFAYLLVYDGSEGIAAVFSMSAPHYPIASRSDPAHAAPIRMYYGADDPNYTGGSAGALEAQWARLGVPYETDVRAGFGHSSWPPDAVRAGLEHLLAVRYPGAPTPSRCGGADAGPVAIDAGDAEDAGARAPDGGVSDPDGGPSPRDAGAADAGDRSPGVSGGCATSPVRRAPSLAWLAVLFLAACAWRARRR